MKQNITVCINQDLVTKLQKEKNKSGLINELVTNHYAGERMSKEALTHAIQAQKHKLSDEKLKMELLEAQMKELTRPRTMEEKLNHGKH